MPEQNTTTVGSTLQDEEFQRILYERKLECVKQLSINATPPPEPYCRGTFDGWSCWPDTPAGEKAYAVCPYFITGFDPSFKAHKDCEENGTWFRHPETNNIWSNYTTCVNLEDLGWQQRLNTVFEVGYTISFIAILISLGIFTYFRSLRCARITLHMNFFASFAISNPLWLIWYGSIIRKPAVLANNGIFCRLLHVVLHYYLLTNYAWMLCEGFYLFTILVSAFTSEHNLVKWLMALGWSAPAVIVLVYALLRGISPDPRDNGQCWIDDGNYKYILILPVIVTTLLNVMFLCIIVFVLFTKLRAGPAIGTRPSRSILQAFRATVLLVPLLGLHYLIVAFRPSKGHPWERVYDVISAITASFQGLCVAIFFCFCNGEVIAQFRRKWEGTMFMRKRANSCTATTVSGNLFSESFHNVRVAPMTTPESNPLLGVDCCSLSDRPQVRYRERKRCDYQMAAPMDEKEEKYVGNHGTPVGVTLNTSRRNSNSINNTRILIRRNDSANDFNQYQTQC